MLRHPEQTSQRAFVFALIAIAVVMLAAIAAVAVVERVSADGAGPNLPTVTKEFVDYSNATVQWKVTVQTPNPIFPGDSSNETAWLRYNLSDATALNVFPGSPAAVSGCGWNWTEQLGLWMDGCQQDSNTTAMWTVYTAITPACELRGAENTVVVTVTDVSSATHGLEGLQEEISVTARQTIADDALCPPEVTKEFVSYDEDTDTALWRVTVKTPSWQWYEGDFGVYRYTLSDPNATSGDVEPPANANCGLPFKANPVLWGCTQGSNTTQGFLLESQTAQTCEEQVIENSVTGEAWFDGSPPSNLNLPGRNPDTWPLFAAASATIPGDPNLCTTVRKFSDNDEDGDFSAGDTFIDDWGISIVCQGSGYAASGFTGDDGPGTIKFSIPPDSTTCEVTEDTDILYVPIGYSLEGDPIEPGITATFDVDLKENVEHTVLFLNDPTELPPPPTKPPGGPPPPGIEVETPTAIPTAPSPPTVQVVEPTPTETPASAVSDITPIAPDAGSGLAESSSSSTMLMFLVAAALMAFGGAGAALSLARKQE
jgi:hypothetical protein